MRFFDIKSFVLPSLLALFAVLSVPVQAQESGASLPGSELPSPEVRQEAASHQARPRREKRVRRVIVIQPRYVVRGGVYYYYQSDGYGPSVEVEVPKGYLRQHRLSVGFGLGATMGINPGGTGFADPGFLFNLRYRMNEPVGLELRAGLYAGMDPDASHLQIPIQASLAFHTPGVVPVGLVGIAGLSADVFRYDFSNKGGAELAGVAIGPHIGGGVRFNLGHRADMELDARLIRYLTPTGWGEGGTSPWATSANLSVNVYF